MRAVISDGRGGVEVAQVPEPLILDPEDAIVRVSIAAVCGTDLGLLAHPESIPAGTILGHEAVGTVAEVGSAVRRFRPGDRVVVSDYTACGRCSRCDRGEHWHCPQRAFFGTGSAFGRELAGAQAELLRVPSADLVLGAIDPETSDADAVLLGDLVPTAWAALDRARMTRGETVAVIGGGPVGQIASLVAQAAGAGPVLLLEPDAGRRRTAADLGAIPLDPGASDAVAGEGVDVVLDCVGGRIGLDAALGLVRDGGRIASVGVPHESEWSMPVEQAFRREITLGFAIGDAMRDRGAFTPLVASRLLRPSDIVSETVPLEDAGAAYARARERAVLKVLLVVP